MGVRLPTILGKAIDDVVKTLNEQVRCTFGLEQWLILQLQYKRTRS